MKRMFILAIILFIIQFFAPICAQIEQKPELVIQTGHSDSVNSVAFSPDGKIFASGSSDAIIKLWHVETGRLIRTLEGHSNRITSVAFSPDNKALASGSWDGAVKLWNIETGQNIKILRGHTDWVRSVAFSPDGKILASGSRNIKQSGNKSGVEWNYDNGIKLWNVETGDLIKSLGISGSWIFSTSVDSITFSTDGKTLIAGRSDNIISLWNIETWQEEKSFEGHADLVKSLAIAPDGKLLASGSADKTIKIWNIETKEEIKSLMGHNSSINSVAFSPDCKLLASGSSDKTIKIWNIETKEEIKSFEQSSIVWSVAFSPEGKTLLSGGSWNQAVTLWNIKTGKRINSIAGYAYWIYSVDLSLDNKILASSGDYDEVKLWNIETDQILNYLDGRGRIAFSPVSDILASGSNGVSINLWNIKTGEFIKALKGHAEKVILSRPRIAFSPDGKILVSGSDDKTIKLWNIETGQLIKSINVQADKFWHSVTSIVFSPNGKIFASTGCSNYSNLTCAVGEIKLWSIETGQLIKVLKGHTDEITSVAFSPDGKILVSGSEDRNIKLWNIETEKEIMSLSGHRSIVNSVAFSSDNKTLASGSNDRTIELWNAETGRLIATLNGHAGWVQSVKFMSSGNIVISGGYDGTLKVWDVKSKKLSATMISLRKDEWVVATPDGRFDTNKLENPEGLHWIMPDAPFTPLSFEIFMRDYYEPNLLPRLLKCTEENTCDTEFKPVRNLTELNRTQPKVIISEIKPTDMTDVVQVTVEAKDAVSEFQKDKNNKLLRSGIEDVRLFRDGQLVGYAPDGEGSVALDKSGTFTKTFNVRLPKNRDLKEVAFTAYAFNTDRVKSETAQKTYTLPKSLPDRNGNAYIVTIGVNANENRLYNLRYAANDARKLRDELQKRLPTNKYEKIVTVPLISDYDQTEKLTQNNAMKAKIKAVLDKLAGRTISNVALKDVPNANLLEKVQPEDLVLIAFSGHGYAAREGVFYLVPYDIGAKNSGGFESIKQKTVSSNELSLWLRDIDAGEMLMIVNACHSAAAVQGKDFKPGPMGARGLGQLSYDKGMRILTATQADNVALELGNLQHGLLTYSLVKNGIELGLADYQPKDNKLFSNEWLSFAVKDVPLLYEKAAKEGLKNLFVDGKPKSDVINLEGQKSNLNLQRPLLFDFNRRNRDYDLFPSINRIDQSIDTRVLKR